MSWDTGADAWSGEDQTTGGGDWASGGPTAAVEEYADQEQSAPVDLSGRQYGVVKRWNEKGFGFIDRDDGGGSVFCHASECPGRVALVPGSKVSYTFEADAKSGKAREVQIEEAATQQADGPREFGTIKSWNTEKGFGFIGRASGDGAFVHKRDCGGLEFVKGQAVSFVIGEGAKGAAAKQVRPEEGGNIEEVAPEPEEEEGERHFGKVKSYNEEKGFTFITPCTGGEDLFSHKKEFKGVEPSIGLRVSYVMEITEKGDAAKKVREEESVPEPVLSDEGREFGTVKNWMTDKGFGFINPKKDGEAIIIFDKETNGITLETDMCVSFKQEEGSKGPVAKDLRQEDPARVARVGAKVHYGKVESYFDPTEKKPTNGYGFITPFNPPSYGAKKYYFHMSEIEDPDEDGGIEPHTGVSYIVVSARKGVQAVAVKIADPPPKKEEPDQTGLESAVAEMGWGDSTDSPAEDTAEDGTWG